MNSYATKNSFKVVAHPFDEHGKAASVDDDDVKKISAAMIPLLSGCTEVEFVEEVPLHSGIKVLAIIFCGPSDVLDVLARMLSSMGYCWRTAYEAGILLRDGTPCS